MILMQGDTLKNGKHPYAIAKKIADGGMSEVFKGLLWGDANFLVVIKKLVPRNVINQQDKEDAERMFQKEIQLLCQLNSEIFPKYIDHFEENGEKYLVMEYIRGRNFDNIVKKHGKLSEDKVKEIGLTLTKATGELHKLRHIHRDITPENIMEDSVGKIRLIDFGVVHPMPKSKNGTQVIQEVWGKPAFVAPEQYSGHADERSDLYAIGRVMQFLLTGKDYKPFEIDLALKKNVSPLLANFLVKTMSYDPKDRFQSAEQMFKALKKIKIRKPKLQKQNMAQPASIKATAGTVKIWNGWNCCVQNDWHGTKVILNSAFLVFILLTIILQCASNQSRTTDAPVNVVVSIMAISSITSLAFSTVLCFIFGFFEKRHNCFVCCILNCLCVPFNLLRLLWQKISALKLGAQIAAIPQKIFIWLKNHLGNWNDAKRFLWSTRPLIILINILYFSILIGEKYFYWQGDFISGIWLHIMMISFLLFGVYFSRAIEFRGVKNTVKMIFSIIILAISTCSLHTASSFTRSPYVGPNLKIISETPIVPNREIKIKWESLVINEKVCLIMPNGKQIELSRNSQNSGEFKLILTKPTTVKFLIYQGNNDVKSELVRLTPIQMGNILDNNKPLKF